MRIKLKLKSRKIYNMMNVQKVVALIHQAIRSASNGATDSTAKTSGLTSAVSAFSANDDESRDFLKRLVTDLQSLTIDSSPIAEDDAQNGIKMFAVLCAHVGIPVAVSQIAANGLETVILFEGIKVLEQNNSSSIDALSRLFATKYFPSLTSSLIDEDEEAATAAAPEPAKESIVIDPRMESSINALLMSATNNKIVNLKALIEERDANAEEVIKLRTALTRRATTASSVPQTGTSTVSTGTLTYKVIDVKASDIFKSPSGRKIKALDFDVKAIEWYDDQGQLVTHPEVPTIDPSYKIASDKLLQYLISMNNNYNTWLFGHTGTGKTTFVEQVCARLGWPVTRINLDSNLERSDLVGHITLANSNGTTVSMYEEGILPRAMQRPGVLLIDEMDAGRPDILFVIQRALESKGLLLTEDNGRIVQPHPLFRFAATANTRGQGDEYGMYAGTRTMNASMLDRFPVFIEFNYMSVADESALLLELNPTLVEQQAKLMCQYAAEIRKAFTNGEIYQTISPRGLNVMAECYATFTALSAKPEAAIKEALNMTIFSKVTKDSQQKMKEIATRVFGQSF